MAELVGVEAAKQKLRRLTDGVVNGFALALEKEADAILARSQSLVPVDTGRLRRSGRRHAAKRAGASVDVEITYGDREAYYALYVHENLRARHPRGGQAKFLEQPALEATRSIADRLGQDVRTVIERFRE